MIKQLLEKFLWKVTRSGKVVHELRIPIEEIKNSIDELKNSVNEMNELLHSSNFSNDLPKIIEKDFVIIDCNFPEKLPRGFRNYEFSALLKDLPNCESFTMYPMKPGINAWFTHGYGMTQEIFNENKEEYLKFYPENKDKLNYLSETTRYKFKLAYSHFLAITYTLLPFYNQNKIPFIFVLYPGGAFGLNNPSSDKMLEEIFSSKYFRGVIVTQKVTYDYLIDKFKINEDKIFYYFGGYAQFEVSQTLPKKKYKSDKTTFDVCFVAFKYSEKGIDKGYDLFVDTARYFIRKYNDIRFHVVGGFDETDIDVSDIKDRFIFYGIKQPDFLLQFYSEMDIFLAPCRPFQLFQGNFDGFPLGSDGMTCGVAIFVADELNNNRGQISENAIVIIRPDLDDIIQKVDFYYNNPEKLYELSLKGQKYKEGNGSLKRLEWVKSIFQKCMY
jgi:glycosyltransferase involved in cell wall biosynthesis